LARFLRTDDLMPCFAQERSQFYPEHLIQVETHNGSSGPDGGEFGVQNGMPRVFQGSLNIIPC
jgi:hypothetical protein